MADQLDLDATEQAVLDEAMGRVNARIASAWAVVELLTDARGAIYLAAEQWHSIAVTLLRLRGLDPAEYMAEIEGGHVTIRPREPARAESLAVESGPPRLFVAYTDAGLQPETKSLGEMYGATFVNTDGATAYFAMYEKLWAEQRGFIAMEQDVLPAPGLIDEMWGCPHEWCSVAYQGERQISVHASIALTKFSTALVRRVPDAMYRAGRLASERNWTQLDVALAWRVLLDEENMRMHWHTPPLEHLRHPAPTEHLQVVPTHFSGPIETVMDSITGSRFMLERARDMLLVGDSRGENPTGKPDAGRWLNGPLALRKEEEPLPWGLIRRPGQRHLNGAVESAPDP